MYPRYRLLLVAIFWALAAIRADAHFLFIHIGPPAEAGRAAEVYFSELAEAGDPRFIDKIAGTQLWIQKAPGQWQPLKVQKLADRLRAQVPMSGSIAVAGTCPYGVLARPKQTPFLLRYHPKAIAGSPEELNRMKPFGKTPLEIVATINGDRIEFTALRDGKPVPKAEFTTVASDLTNENVAARDNGKASWKPSAPGRYSVYTRYVTKEGGAVNGQSYEEIRDFATIAFTWPLERKDADAEAVALFEQALAARAQWKGFPGFTASIAGKLDGRDFSGNVTVEADGSVRFETKGKAAKRWVEDQLGSIALHRGARGEERAKPVLRFGDDEENHPLGRLLIFDGGQFASSYRVKDKQLMVVNRHIGRLNMTIAVLDNERNAEGRFLPRSYTVQYWDAETGELRRTETVLEKWQRVGQWDLPILHTVTTASGNGLTVRSFSLTEHQLLKKKN